MADQTRKAKLAAEVDASGAKKGFEEIKQGARDMAGDVGRAAQQAGKAVDGIGQGGAGSAQKVDAATRSIVGSIQRTTAAMEAGGRVTSRYYEILANQRGVNVDALRPYLAQLDEVNRKQAAANQSLGNGAATLNAYGQSARQTAQALRQVPAQFTDIITSISAGQAPLQVLLQQGGQLKDTFGGIGPAARALGGYVAGLVGPVTLTAAAIVGLSVAAVKGGDELRNFQNQATLSGNALGLTNSRFSELREAIGSISTQGKAAEVLAALAAFGSVASGSIRELAEAAILMEKATGQAVSKTVEQFRELARSPADATAKLNEQYNYLTAAVYRQIKALEDQGRAQEAASLAERTYAQELATRARSVVENAGWIERAWRGVTGAAKGAWDAILGVGRQTSQAEQLGILQRNLEERRQRNRTLGIGDANGDTAATRDVMTQIDLLRENERMEKRLAESQAERARVTRQTIEWEKQGEEFLNKREKRERELTRAQTEGQALVNAGIITETQLRQRLAGIREKYKDDKPQSGVAGTGENEVAGFRARIRAEQQQAEILRSRIQNLNFMDPPKLTEAEQAVLKLQEELRSSVNGVARAQKEKALVEAQALVIAEKSTAALQQQYETTKKAQGQLDRLVETTGEQADSTRRQAAELEAANATFGQSKTAIEQMVLAQLKLQAAEADASDTFDPRYVASLNAKVQAQERYVAALQASEAKQIGHRLAEGARVSQEEAATLQTELSLIGQTQKVREQIIGQRRVEVQLAKELLEIDRSGATEVEKEKLREAARAKSRIDAANVANRAMLDDFQRTADSINESLTDALVRGFEAGKDAGENLRDTLKSMFGTLVLRPIIQAVMAPVGGAVGGVGQILGGGSSASAGGMAFGNGGMGNLNNLGLVGAGVQALTGASVGASAASLGYANVVGAVGGDALGALIAANGSWAGVGVGAAGAAGGVGAAGATGAAGAAGAGGVGTTAAAAIPVVGWVVAIASLLYSIFGNKGGGPKAEGFFNPYNSDQYFSSNNPQVSSSSRKAAEALQKQYDSIAQSFGGKGNLQFGLGISADPAGDDQTMLHIGAGRDGTATFNLHNSEVGRDEEDLQRAIADLSARALLQGLQQSNIAGTIGEYLNRLGDVASLAADQVAEAIARIQKAGSERQALEQRLFDLTHTALERAVAAREKERDALDESNRSLYDHVVRLSDLTDALNVRRDALLAAYQSESTQLQSVVTQHSAYAKQLREMRDSLSLSEMPLTRSQRTALATSRFTGTLAGAISGNENDIQGLGNAGRDYIEAIKQTARTPAEVAAAVARVQAGLTSAASSADGRATVAQQQLDAMKQQLTALSLLNDTIKTFAQALEEYQQARTSVDTEVSRGYANGGLAQGVVRVGEKGEEIVDFETPGRVYTNEQTKGMFASNAELLPAVQRLCAETAAARKEAMTAQVAVVNLLQKLETRTKKWDANGVPQGEDMTA